MDSANERLHTAFDKTFKRLYKMTEHAGNVADGLLALITVDTVACDALDISPYVITIIPEPVDYFARYSCRLGTPSSPSRDCGVSPARSVCRRVRVHHVASLST
jgi:hypothetical protein